MTRSKVKVKVTSAWKPLKRSRLSVPHGTTEFSWFGNYGSVNWFKSYLSSRSFRVRYNNTFSSFYTSSSVLWYPPFPNPPPLCRRHPTAFLISPAQLRLKHHSAIKCPSANLFLTANLLTLNSPKTELVYSLDSKSNLTGYTTSHLTPPTLIATLASSFTNTLLSPTKFRPSAKLAITVLGSSVVSVIKWRR